MKTFKFYAGAAALLAMGAFSSCSSDEPMKGQDPGKVEVDQTQYMTVAICNPTSGNSGGRADFQDGSEAESAVNKLVFVFYDGAGNPTATMKSVTGDELANGWSDKDLNKDIWNNQNVTRFWKSTIPVEMTQGQNKPAYVMCYVNPIDETGISTMTIKELEAATRYRIKKEVGDKEYFAMSNSVYYGSDPISGQTGVRIMATPIVDGKLFDTEAEADAATGDDTVVNIFVERYAAKIGLTLAPNKIDPYYVNVVGADGKTTTAGQIVFTPAYWRPNAIDEETYVTKAFATSAATGPTEPATLTEMDNAFANTGLTDWNSPDDHRSYWACSPSYYADKYPRVSDNITDDENWETEFPYALRYFTYNQIDKGITGTKPAEKGIKWDTTAGFTTNAGSIEDDATGYFYSRETTASLDNITSTIMNNKAVVASAVIVGNYKLTGNTDNTDFYLYGKKDNKDNYYGTEALLKSVMLANQSVIFTDDQGENVADVAAWFEVEHPEKEVRGTENVAGRLVTLQLKNTLPENQALYFYDGATKAYTVINADNLAAANRLLWKTVSTAQMFNNGLAFFSIPIRHLGFGVNDNGVELVDPEHSNVYNWQNIRCGDFGIVRNHVYNLTVNGIKGLGVGLRSANQPIVPPMDPDNYYVAARLNILAWRLVSPQGVDL